MNHFHRSIKYYLASLTARHRVAVRNHCRWTYRRGVNVVFIDATRDKLYAAHSLFETRRRFVTFHRLLRDLFDDPTPRPDELLAAVKHRYDTYDPDTEIVWLFVSADVPVGDAIVVVTPVGAE